MIAIKRQLLDDFYVINGLTASLQPAQNAPLTSLECDY